MGNHIESHHTEEKKPVAFIVPLLFGLFVIAVILWFVSLGDNDPNASHGHSDHSAAAHGSNPHNAHGTATVATTHDTTEIPHGVVHESMMVKLANGKELEAYKGGIEDNLVAYLNDANAEISKEKWFDFDNLLFETGKTTLTPESNKQLSNIAEILAAYPKVKIKLGGYTDNVGDSMANVTLSQKRAESVLEELVKLKANKTQLTKVEGYGPQHAIADNSTEEGRAKNRRISINVKEK